MCWIHNIWNWELLLEPALSDKLKTQALEKKRDKRSGNHHLGKRLSSGQHIMVHMLPHNSNHTKSQPLAAYRTITCPYSFVKTQNKTRNDWNPNNSPKRLQWNVSIKSLTLFAVWSQYLVFKSEAATDIWLYETSAKITLGVLVEQKWSLSSHLRGG